ncbi:hypothetical protein [Rhizobium sp.]
MKFAYLIEPPFNHRDADGTVTGCDVELVRHDGSIGFNDAEIDLIAR